LGVVVRGEQGMATLEQVVGTLRRGLVVHAFVMHDRIVAR
jgi:hypothetical protein